jgi:hypothetical protein
MFGVVSLNATCRWHVGGNTTPSTYHLHNEGHFVDYVYIMDPINARVFVINKRSVMFVDLQTCIYELWFSM